MSPIPLNLSFPDGLKRRPVKSSLMKIIDYTQVVEDGAYANVGACIVDLMAAIRAIGIFLIVEELLIDQVLSIIPREQQVCICPQEDIANNCKYQMSLP